MITSSVNRDSFHALNPNSNLNANPTHICHKIILQFIDARREAQANKYFAT